MDATQSTSRVACGGETTDPDMPCRIFLPSFLPSFSFFLLPSFLPSFPIPPSFHPSFLPSFLSSVLPFFRPFLLVLGDGPRGRQEEERPQRRRPPPPSGARPARELPGGIEERGRKAEIRRGGGQRDGQRAERNFVRRGGAGGGAGWKNVFLPKTLFFPKIVQVLEHLQNKVSSIHLPHLWLYIWTL